MCWLLAGLAQGGGGGGGQQAVHLVADVFPVGAAVPAAVVPEEVHVPEDSGHRGGTRSLPDVHCSVVHPVLCCALLCSAPLSLLYSICSIYSVILYIHHNVWNTRGVATPHRRFFTAFFFFSLDAVSIAYIYICYILYYM